jgi:hypothetical protein
MIEVLKLAIAWAEKHGEAIFAGGGMAAIEPMNEWVMAGQQAIAELESQERNFCPRCGKKSGGIDSIHTCTPPAAQPEQPEDKLSGNFEQPNWAHVGQAFIDGAREARANPDATDDTFVLSADAYTKQLFEKLDPESERLLRENAYPPAAQPEQQPVGYVTEDGDVEWYKEIPPEETDLYTTPPAAAQPERKPLTDAHINKLREKYGVTSNGRGIREFENVVSFARAIEAAHGIKEGL